MKIVNIPTNIVQKRSLWGWLNVVFNKLDPDRVKAVGPDRAAAEWLLRCGASVRYKSQDSLLKDYNRLPAEGTPNLFIEEIDATDSCVMYRGFPHLNGLQHLKKIKLHNAKYVDVACLYQLKNVKDTLENLQISANGTITKSGLMNLCELKNLRELLMFDLPSVDDPEKCVAELQACLKDCHIDFSSADARD